MKFSEELINAPMGDGGGKARLKLKDGETVTGIFRGDIATFYQNWPKGGVKTVDVEPFAGAQLRFEVNFVVKEGAGYIPKIFEGGLKIYKQLAALHKEYNLEETVFKISRSGVEKQTAYTFMPAKQAPSAETLNYLKTIELLPVFGQAPTAQPKVDSEEVPF